MSSLAVEMTRGAWSMWAIGRGRVWWVNWNREGCRDRWCLGTRQQPKWRELEAGSGAISPPGNERSQSEIILSRKQISKQSTVGRKTQRRGRTMIYKEHREKTVSHALIWQ